MIDLESRHLPRLISWTAYVVLCIYIGIPSHSITISAQKQTTIVPTTTGVVEHDVYPKYSREIMQVLNKRDDETQRRGRGVLVNQCTEPRSYLAQTSQGQEGTEDTYNSSRRQRPTNFRCATYRYPRRTISSQTQPRIRRTHLSYNQ